MNELNANFNAFVNFARAQMAAGNEKAVARLGEQGSFTLGAGRVITAAKVGDANYDAAYKAFRSAAAKDANMAVRDLFLKSMVEIFGSESRIPDSVKAQMTNFGTSKPLTARRIMAISNAVTAYQTQLRESATVNIGKLNRLGVMSDVDAAKARLAIARSNDPVFLKKAEAKYANEVANHPKIMEMNDYHGVEDAHPDRFDQDFKALLPKLTATVAKSGILMLQGNSRENVVKMSQIVFDITKDMESLGEGRSYGGCLKALTQVFSEDPDIQVWLSGNKELLDSVADSLDDAVRDAQNEASDAVENQFAGVRLSADEKAQIGRMQHLSRAYNLMQVFMSVADVQNPATIPQDAASTALRDMRKALSGLASVKDVPQEFLDNARAVIDRETTNITAARDKFLAGEIGERELLKSLKESFGAFRNLTDYHVMKPISDQNAELGASLKKICEAAQKSIENVINARVDVLNKEAIAPFVAQVKENPASQDLPADWEASLMKNFAEVSVDKGIKCARQFAEKFCADPSAFKPTLNQLARIRAFAPTPGSAAMLAKALSDQAIYEAIKDPNAKVSIEDKIVLFEQNASLRELLTIGLDSKLSLQEIMSDISDRITDAYNWGASKGTKDFKGFNSDGLHVQCLREVNGGSLTINGKQVADKPVALKSYVAEGYGDLKGKELAYAEEIMNRFDEQHLGMRRIVTLMTGMADGINGVFDAAFDGTSEKTKLLPQEKSRPYLGATTNSAILGGTKSKDGYDITVADNGDVTIKSTKYVQNHISQLQGVTCGADVDGRGCLIAETRFEVTVTIPNQTDAELNGGMPKFTVTDFKQEQL